LATRIAHEQEVDRKEATRYFSLTLSTVVYIQRKLPYVAMFGKKNKRRRILKRIALFLQKKIEKLLRLYLPTGSVIILVVAVVVVSNLAVV